MLCLKVTSQPQWINEAKNNLKQVLIDHAHSEKKAAMNAIALLNRYPERNNMVEKSLL
jgi:tRNA-(ms[2]io[6]A)-hydroxylase